MSVSAGLVLLTSGCSSARPRIADETKVEEWGPCGQSRPLTANLVCLELRHPL
jgi:hypothetical protein